MVALPINLQNLLRHRTVESERIEYKAAWNPDAIIRTLCAFANDFENLGGGYIIIGQDCDAEGRPITPPLGLVESQIDKIQRELLAACQQIRPPYFPSLSICDVDDRKLISYQEREPIEVRIMRDEILVLSYPGPDRSIKLADWIAGHATCHRYRNRRI